MPCKNAGNFLKECIQSIINQNYTNWELIVCNDHSTDHSLKVLQSYSEKDERIKVLNNVGDGIIDALNTAYNQSTGKYITRMDADDKMPPIKLKTLYELLKNTCERSLATGKVEYFPKEEIKEGFLAYELWLNKLCDYESHWKSIFKECVIPSPCWMMKREDFDKIGGFQSYEYPEDYDLAWRMFLAGTIVQASKEILHWWRDHPERTSRTSKVYQNQTYFSLKVDYMKKMPEIKDKTWVIWGAGKKGKSLAQTLIQKGIKGFRWVCNNQNKIGRNIHGVTLESTESISENKHKAIILICVSNIDEQNEITQFLNSKNYQKSTDYFIMV